jgi:hypothetical protein
MTVIVNQWCHVRALVHQCFFVQDILGPFDAEKEVHHLVIILHCCRLDKVVGGPWDLSPPNSLKDRDLRGLLLT